MSSTPASPPEVTFRPERTHLLGAIIMAAIGILAAGSAPTPWCWILMALFLVVVALFCWWTLRTRTAVSESGISLVYAFKSAQKFSWDDIKGVSFKGSRTLLHTTNQGVFTVPVVSFNNLPQLQEASRGRIPDVLTQGREAVDAKVRVVHRDGHQVLLSEEEYEEYQQCQQARRPQD
ncbi:PH domain-containing protein [Corynebacterium poyangense]|uniref:PH domain-containing protein n=1 Tax=Corynebacterium poyangense TaxID=2684405 RepID=A0A7H0SNH4_9CORY|nr:PH domain-containing protein [Corynebacterium poyangense]MBZ8177129.1 PH domain-containing protein [Corynebacterium poyangense]QNQ90099.1 PH domain-containing protein [Corynebacterium poyangense]